jgi:Cof subfamily protein (haloacid dehalogenase superfamily)
MLALDVDGTLLDRRGELRRSTVEALDRARAAGIRTVLCTGRRYRRAREISERLGWPAPLVCNSGALVKDPETHATLWAARLEGPVLAMAVGVLRGLGHPLVSFLDDPEGPHDFRVEAYPTGRAEFDAYVSWNHEHARLEPGWTARAMEQRESGHFHLCAVGDVAGMTAAEAALHERLPDRLRTFVQRAPRYEGMMCEVLSPEASKWSAVLHLAELWGVDPAAICAVGDDRNDVPMIAGAGLGVAMGHAPPEVLAVADHITGAPEDDGLARLVDEVLLP